MFLYHLDEDNKSFTGIYKKINLLKTIYFSKRAWDRVSVKVIENCFRKTKFVKLKNAESERGDETVIYTSDDNEIQDEETIIYDFKKFEAGDFGQQTFSKSELV